jgi:hypothetical protein
LIHINAPRSAVAACLTRGLRRAESDPSVDYLQKPEAAMASPAADLLVLDTLGKLHPHGHGLNRYCRPCRRFFLVSMPVLIAARGRGNVLIWWGSRVLRGKFTRKEAYRFYILPHKPSRDITPD